LPGIPAVRGVNFTGSRFQDVATGRFVTNNYGIGRYSVVYGAGAAPAFHVLLEN